MNISAPRVRCGARTPGVDGTRQGDRAERTGERVFVARRRQPAPPGAREPGCATPSSTPPPATLDRRQCLSATALDGRAPACATTAPHSPSGAARQPVRQVLARRGADVRRGQGREPGSGLAIAHESRPPHTNGSNQRPRRPRGRGGVRGAPARGRARARPRARLLSRFLRSQGFLRAPQRPAQGARQYS